MTRSESFDPHSGMQSDEQFAQLLPENSPEIKDLAEAEISPYVNWQEHLLPIACIHEEDNLTVLRMELETAHQLLQYQQSIVNSLTEQLTNCTLQLQHTQAELTTAQQVCDQKSSQLTEVEAICRDLKMQLRRQQQRVLQYRNLVNERMSSPTELPQNSFQSASVAIGYETISVETQAVVCPKSHPVSAWSAPKPIDLTGPLTRYRKLATIRMTTSTVRVESIYESLIEPDSARKIRTIKPYSDQPQDLETKHAVRVDLPSFTRMSAR